MNVTDITLCRYTFSFQLTNNISVYENLLIIDPDTGVMKIYNSYKFIAYVKIFISIGTDIFTLGEIFVNQTCYSNSTYIYQDSNYV